MGSKYEFDAIIIGGGAAGLTASGMAANFGAKTMMIEQDRLGGDCTWTGCIPSKTLLKAGKVAHQIQNAGRYGLIDRQPEINFKSVIEHVHKQRKEVYEEADRPEIYEDMGIEVIKGAAQFVDEHRIEIDLQDAPIRKVSARYFFICTGGHPYIPPIKGIEDVSYLTSETLFEMEDLPGQLTIIGAGPVGIEMAQAMNRLGAEVTVIDMADTIMAKDNPELTQMLQNMLEQEGIRFELGANVQSARQNMDKIEVMVQSREGQKTISGGQLLIAAGRQANTAELNLETAGVDYSPKGIKTNGRCQTSQSHIYACGDVTGRYQFTHMSEHMAKVAVTNALLKYPVKVDADHVPWVTYTDPELAHTGATQRQLEEEGRSFEIYRFPYSKIDRALTESEGEGLIKIYAKRWSGKILGASILGAHAGELVSEYALAMKNGVTLRNIADTIHPYPSYGLGARRAADQWYIKNQSEWQVKLLKKLFGYRGDVPDFSNPDRIV